MYSGQLGARHPERIAAVRRVRALAANRLRASEEPTTLRRQVPNRRPARERQRAVETADQSARQRDVHCRAPVGGVAARCLEAQIGERAEAPRRDAVLMKESHRRADGRTARGLEIREEVSDDGIRRALRGRGLTFGERAPIEPHTAFRRPAKLATGGAIVEALISSEEE